MRWCEGVSARGWPSDQPAQVSARTGTRHGRGVLAPHGIVGVVPPGKLGAEGRVTGLPPGRMEGGTVIGVPPDGVVGGAVVVAPLEGVVLLVPPPATDPLDEPFAPLAAGCALVDCCPADVVELRSA
jgi:hypothetical protein